MRPIGYLGLVVAVLACGLLMGCGTSSRAGNVTTNVRVDRQIGRDPDNDYQVQMFRVAERYPGFAGFYSGEGGRLTILTTAPDSTEGIVYTIFTTFADSELIDNVAAGVDIVQVEHSYVELYGYRMDLLMALRENGFLRMDGINILNNNIDLGFESGISEAELYRIIDISGVPRNVVNIITGIAASGD